MTAETCALPGCYNPPRLSVRQAGDSPPLACSNLHHQLLMAGRFNPTLPHPYQPILDRSDAGLCALRSCDKPPCVGFSWCSRFHFLSWLTEFASTLQTHQICMFPGCTRHVFVDDNAQPSQFCGWRHQQKFVMLSALQHRRQELEPSVEVPLQPPPLPACSNESECGHLPPLNSLMHSLKQFALFGIAPKNIRVIDDFYEKHPWEVLTEGHACWLIAGLKYTSKGRKLTTKGHYHWKQSGPRAKNTGKYYIYTKRKGRGKEADQQHAESSMKEYTMKEYTMEDVTAYSLIHLVKEKRSSYGGKLGKEQPSEQQIADQVDNAAPQHTLTSQLSLGDDQDIIFGDLSPLVDFTVS